ncbi:MAG: rod shape-determining protein RodA [gamma proteobacterium symbiont of Bathyaustriella thionipta]|nr:rod shape-determining protein RodA [gamma proteobacterium symbiont of Bathyaustriella thionipta]
MSLYSGTYSPSGLSESNPVKHPGLLARLHLDLTLLSSLILLCLFGLIVLYSAADQHWAAIYRQLLRLGAAYIVMLVIAQIPPAIMRRWTPAIYSIGLLLLIAVLVFGHVGKGAQRWLDLGVFRFQPSEMMKLAVPMMVAWFISERTLPPRFRHLLGAMLIIAIPAFLIARQPDLGTSLLVASAGLLVLFLAGISWRLIMGAIGMAAAMAYPLWYFMHDYQRQRVLTFLNPESDPLGHGYHIIQSKIAIGSGGLYGKGWLFGTQSHLEFLPERSTDFIYAVISEEFGLLGVSLLLSLYAFIIIRGLYLATQGQSTYGRLLAGALIMTFFVYVLVNTGMVSGLLPVVGVPLPLISYGGTSLVTLMAGFGILMSVYTHRKLLPT